MGCWNETCGLTQLAIVGSEEIVAFVIRAEDFRPDRLSGPGTNGWYAPVGLPFYGVYDDYGSLDPDPAKEQYHLAVMRHLGAPDVSVEDFLRGLARGESGMDTDTVFHAQMLVKKTALDVAMESTGSEEHVPYGSTVARTVRGGMQDALKTVADELADPKKIALRVQDEKYLDEELDLGPAKPMILSADTVDMLRNLWAESATSPVPAKRFLSRYDIHDALRDADVSVKCMDLLDPDVITDDLVEGIIIVSLMDIALFLLRKSWMPQHSGSQHEELRLTKVMAEYALATIAAAQIERDHYENWESATLPLFEV